MSIRNSKFVSRNYKKGMSYVELIVVLSIFSLLSGVIIYNYQGFQSKVDIKSLANDIALKIVDAQKTSLSGQLPQATFASDWKPSYGVFFDLYSKSSSFDNKGFVYFVDLDQDGMTVGCTSKKDGDGGTECLEKVSLTKNNIISKLVVFYQSDPNNPSPLKDADLAITFSRPSSSAVFYSLGAKLEDVSHVEITTISPDSSSQAVIRVYSSGRIQVN